MKIGTKVALSMTIVGIMAMSAFYAMVLQVWVKNYDVLEQKDVQDNIRRTSYAFQVELANLTSQVGDWAPWDDLYSFAQNPAGSDFVEKNLKDAAMANLRVDMVVVTNPAGKIIFAKAINLERKTEIPVPADLGRHFQPRQSFLDKAQGDQAVSGILFIDNHPVMVAVQRIFKSDGSGESTGILAFFHTIDQALLDDFSKRVQTPVHIKTDHQLLEAERGANGVAVPWQTVVDARNKESIRAYVPVPDLYGNNRLSLLVDTERIYFFEAQKQMKQYAFLGGILTVIMILIAIFGMKTLITSRLQKIDAFLNQVYEQGDIKMRLSLSGNDELTQVASSINLMLESIARSNKRIEDLNNALKRELGERSKMEARLQHVSWHDALTGLQNRAYFEAELHKIEEQGAEGVGVISCDIDGLKLMNDTMGHAVGDLMLQRTAAILRRIMPDTATVARTGGDEFIILITNIGEEELLELCQEIRDTAAHGDESEIPLQISLGIQYRTVCQPRENVLNQMIKDADDAMYRQKLSSSQSARNVVVQTMLKMLEARDFITEGHSQRLGRMAVLLADKNGLSEDRKNDLMLLSQFHDIGKIGVSDTVLFKPGQLTSEERLEIERHAEIGHRIALVIPELLPVSDLILKHHEWWDGTGYPLRLQGEDIPLEDRILSIVDAFDAMTNDRPYRKGMTVAKACTEILRCKGSQFDPLLVEQFLELIAEMPEYKDSQPTPESCAGSAREKEKYG